MVISDEQRVCWVNRSSNSIMLANTVNSPEDEIKKFQIRSLGPGEDKLHIRYSILVKQSSVSKEMYDFWKQLMDVNQNSGGIYGKNPARVFGNISCCDGSIKALGYFSTSAVRVKRLFIERTEHHMETVSAYKGCIYFDYDLPGWIPKSFFGTIEGTDTRVYSQSRRLLRRLS